MTQILIYFIIFAAATLFIYAIFPKKFRYLVLLISSLTCYACYSGFLIVFLLSSVAVIYLLGLAINKNNLKHEDIYKTLEKEDRKRLKKKVKKINTLYMALAITINLAILFTLKYYNFFASGMVNLFQLFGVKVNFGKITLLLPLGISYYTLQAMSYIIDVSRGRISVQRNPFKLALFVGFFPQLYEGPIGRYNDLMPQLESGKQISDDNFKGLFLALWGFFKIMVISYRLSMICSPIFKNYSNYSGLVIVLAIICFTFQLYTEFSGYVDVARGVSQLLGIELANNFDKPFISKTVPEFWRRWHITLGTWFKDYVFFPLSMSKASMKFRKAVNPVAAEFLINLFVVFVVWFLTGLWHGASLKYIVYGLYYLMLILASQLLEKPFAKLYNKLKINPNGIILAALRILKTFLLVCVGMLIFRAENLEVFGKMFISIFDFSKNQFALTAVLDISEIVVLALGLAVVLTSGILSIKNISMINIIMKNNVFVKAAVALVVIFILIIFGAYGNGYLPPDPIYGGF